MNDLSLFIYLAGASTGFKGIFFASGMLIIAGWLLANFFTINEDTPFYHFSNGVFNWKYPIIGATFILISNFLPDQQTLYMIAGSELGEVVINTPEANEIYQSLKTILLNYANGVSK